MVQKKTDLVAHCLVKNESRWIWFALNSILNFVDRIMVWDTGSTDNTVEIIKSIKSSKVEFRQMGPVDEFQHTDLRNRMLDNSKTASWFMILDGDEVWPNQALEEVNRLVKSNKNPSLIVSPYISLVGDIYHKLPNDAGRYRIHEFSGNFNIRFVNAKIPGLKIINPHGHQTYVDDKGNALQDFPRSQMVSHPTPYWHMSHLIRSQSRTQDLQTTKRKSKFKLEVGETIPKTTKYPEVLYFPRPSIVSDPWQKMSASSYISGLALTPLKRLKRSLLPSRKVGY